MVRDAKNEGIPARNLNLPPQREDTTSELMALRLKFVRMQARRTMAAYLELKQPQEKIGRFTDLYWRAPSSITEIATTGRVPAPCQPKLWARILEPLESHSPTKSLPDRMPARRSTTRPDGR